MSTHPKETHEEDYQTQRMEELDNKDNNLEVKTLNTSTESSKPSVVHLECDEILKKLGGFGRWQWLNFALLSLPVVVSGLVLLTYSFTGFKPEKYRCMIPECDVKNSDFLVLNESIFHHDQNGEVDYCKTYPLKTSFEKDGVGKNCTISHFNFSATPKQCNAQISNVVYGKFVMETTIVTEFNLFCNEDYKIALVGSIYMVGIAVGALIIGRMSDVFGRKIAVTLSIMITAIAQLAGGFTHSYWPYVFTRFLAGAGALGTFLAPFTLIIELVEPKYRALVGIGLDIPFALGEASVGILAWLIPNWRSFQYITSVPIFLLVLIHFIIPESPRWLITKQKYKELNNLVKKIAKVNKVPVPSDIENSLLLAITDEPESKSAGWNIGRVFSSFNKKESTKPQEKNQIIQIFTNPILRINTLVMFFNWAFVTLGWYGISMASSKLGTNAYVSTASAALTEIPAYIFVILLMDHWGRKPLLSSSFFLTGIICIPAGFTHGNLQLILALIGKFGAAAAFALVYLYTAELYPTNIRGTALGLCCMFARIGGFLAPQVALRLSKDSAMIVMGVCSLIGGLITLLLPETLGTLLCETNEDLVDLKRDGKPFFAWWTKKQLQTHLDMVMKRKLKNEISSVT